MKKSDLNCFLLAILIAIGATCSNAGKGTVVEYTTILAASDINTNEYKNVTAKRVIFDTVKVITVDSSLEAVKKEKRKVRDTAYFIWWKVPVLDSTRKKYMRNSANTGDSLMYDFVPIERELVVEDYMKSWPVKN